MDEKVTGRERGTAYGVGVGPGDPELMTLKAIRLIRKNDVIAVPGKVAKESVAYKIAAAVVPELAEKTLVPIYMPMVKDREAIHESHREGARMIEDYLDQGKNVVYLTLGDSTIYCTFTYLQAILEKEGYRTKLVNGVTSFCAAAARLNVPIAEWNEDIHIVPASHKKDDLSLPGNYILMKSASHLAEVKALAAESGKQVMAVENCGMEGEKVYRSIDEVPENAGYFFLLLAKDAKNDD